jgi:hypothetical protein
MMKTKTLESSHHLASGFLFPQYKPSVWEILGGRRRAHCYGHLVAEPRVCLDDGVGDGGRNGSGHQRFTRLPGQSSGPALASIKVNRG